LHENLGSIALLLQILHPEQLHKVLFAIVTKAVGQ